MLSCKHIYAIILRRTNSKVLSKYFSASDAKDDYSKISDLSRMCALCKCCPCSCNPSKVYDSRKYGHSLPNNDIKPNFPTLPDIPTGVFRNTVEECLGPQGQAGKECSYKNPEYFSFHHMTYYDMHLFLRNYRKPTMDPKRKPP